MPAVQAERDAILRVADRYRERGFEVFAEPRGEQIPPFLRPHHPDLIARKDDTSYVIEVMRPGARRGGPWQEIARRTEQEAGWHFRLVILPDSEGEAREVALPDKSDVLRKLEDVEQLLSVGEADAALLMAWALLEASARLRLLDQRDFSPVAEPRFLIKSLAHLGHVDDGELARLRAVMGRRNSVAHGFLHGDIEAGDVRFLVDVSRRLLRRGVEDSAA